MEGELTSETLLVGPSHLEHICLTYLAILGGMETPYRVTLTIRLRYLSTY